MKLTAGQKGACAWASKAYCFVGGCVTLSYVYK